ncbi:hypothetical protein BDZ85DRAFT_124671 [Elsinoe ampelina]|uniref:Uncharacterized protein n=1 Tax=Elsinoe ampelina TaxID=302913 RepID=A0A6A6GC18_9PEZI|nr:hypothetical protein BDZ85DRAFT_124671 [Elsinoe ampelina]
MILGRFSRVILAVLCLFLSLAAASPVAKRDASDVGFVTGEPFTALGQPITDLDTISTEENAELVKRQNPSGVISIPPRRTPGFNDIIVGAVRVITYYTVKGAIEIYVKNLSPHAAAYKLIHAPGGIITGIVPANMQDHYTNPANFGPGDLIDIAAVPR